MNRRIAMNELLAQAPALGAGLVLGAVFFGGLWWTVRRGVSSNRPALWFFGSFALRILIVLAGFYAVAGGQWRRLAACLLGFVFARFFVTRLARSPVAGPAGAQEAPHAP